MTSEELIEILQECKENLTLVTNEVNDHLITAIVLCKDGCKEKGCHYNQDVTVIPTAWLQMIPISIKVKRDIGH